MQCVQRDLATILAEEPKPQRGKRRLLPVMEEVILEEMAPVVNEITEEIVNDQIVVEVEPVIDNGTHEVVIETIENE